ncbi:MAG: hypothetical protein AAF135_25375, partial [Bacteroidota bacterium]
LIVGLLLTVFEMITGFTYQLVQTENRNPFVTPYLLTGLAILVVSYLFVEPFGIMGLLLCSLFCQGCYLFWIVPRRAFSGLK